MNEMTYRTFAVAPSTNIRTNSGVALQTDDTVASLRGKEAAYDALVFACGNAMPVFAQHANEPWNQAMLSVIQVFADQRKMIVGHCAFALLLDSLGIARGQKVALHPYIKDVVHQCIGTDAPFQVNDNVYTAQSEHTIEAMLPVVLKALKGA